MTPSSMKHRFPEMPDRFAGPRAARGRAQGSSRLRLRPSAFSSPKSQIPNPKPCRGGVTLIELLVVMAIFAILAAIAVPMIQPALESRRAREAARAVSVYLGSARNRAMETGRPCGVILRRMEAEGNACMVLERAEVPPPYGGDTTTATATLQLIAADDNFATVTLTDCNTSLVSIGDLIQFNNQGPLYEITTAPPTSFTATAPVGSLLPWPVAPSSSSPVPYKIHRQPIKSAAVPMQLPTTTVIDLRWSGSDTTASQLGWQGLDESNNDAMQPVMLMFSPNGSLHEIRYAEPTSLGPPPTGFAATMHRLTEPVYLLVGRREQVGVGPAAKNVGNEDEMANWQILSNFWIGINPQTGMVTTAEDAAVESMSLDPTDPADHPELIRESRAFAGEAQSMGGR